MRDLTGKRVIVRCEKSGVFYGTLESRVGLEVELTDCRRIWYWDGAAAIEQLATAPNLTAECKFTVPVPYKLLIDAKEITPCTEVATEAIDGVPVWQR